MMIEGSTMAAIISDPSLQKEIANLLILADSVILYRSSPSQKAELVQLMKQLNKRKKICAIGDGANDVSML
jgi:P-type E1-E2 ATPase